MKSSMRLFPDRMCRPGAFLVLFSWALLVPTFSRSKVTGIGRPEESAPVLDEAVETLHAEPMIYPLYARVRAIEGVVVIRATVDLEGRVRETQALSGPKGLLSEPVENIKKWRFAQPGHSPVVVVYWFRIRGLCEPPCHTGFEFYPPNLAVITIGKELATPSGAAAGRPRPPPGTIR
jgi:hypothetical protein